MKYILQQKLKKAEVIGDEVVVTIEKDGKKIELKAEKVLSAIGVTGNVEGFGLEELGIELYKNHIKVDKNNYETNVPGIYAIGDVIGPPWLAHVASSEGIHCVETMKGLNPHPINYNNIPGMYLLHSSSCKRWIDRVQSARSRI